MKNVCFAVISFSLICIIFLSQLKLINRPIEDNDEGIYLTTFQLIAADHPAYKETFLSQPPGFLLTTYPGFILFGKTLPAARLTIGVWSLIGLLAIIWVGFELKNEWAGLLTIALLYLIPFYYKQTVTFQSDILISTFSMLSLAFLLGYKRSSHLAWFVVSTIFFNLAFWTKFDISLISSLVFIILILYRNNKNSLSQILLLLTFFIAVSIIFFLIFIFPFGLNYIINNSVELRFQALGYSQSSFMQLINYLNKNIVLYFIIGGSIFLSFKRKESFQYPALIFFIWTVFISALIFVYRPVFLHHFVILSVPLLSFFSYSLYLWAKINVKFPSIFIFISFLVFTSIVNYLYTVIKTPVGLLNRQQQYAVEIILKNTKPDDIVVSDEEILNGISGRLPPPPLSDVSNVRISSNNLSSEKFKQLITDYKPRLIIAWNGRLQSINNFNEVIKNYKKLITIGNFKIIYIRGR